MGIARDIQFATLRLAIRLATGLALLLGGSLASAQAPTVAASPPVSPAEERLLALAELQRTLDYALYLPADAPVPVTLRDALRSLLARERPRMVLLLNEWLDEELKTARSKDLAEARQAVSNRVLNEMMLWRLDSAGAAHDQRLVRAAMRPAACVSTAIAPYMVELGTLLAQVPAAEQAAALAAEGELLGRWGQPRPRAAALPAPWLDDLAWQHIERLRETGTPPPLPMPTWLAWNFLVESPDDDLKQHHEGLCRLRQWQLAMAFAGRAEPFTDAQRAQQRLLLAPLITRWWGAREPDTADPLAYPRLAQRLGVTGKTLLGYELDAQGQARDIRVVGREIAVPGIHGQRPVAFEALLDAGSLRRARLIKPKPPGTLPPGERAAQQVVELVWELK